MSLKVPIEATVTIAPGQVVVTPKPWYLSKTIWFNVLTTAVGFAGGIPNPIAMAIAGIGNVVLRVWFTDAKIK